jgi:DNA polymerase III subunit gamma/tau
MSYVALYRKFRPQTFAEVKGQEHVVRALTNQLINNRIGHAYLFTGTRGTGKTSAAKIFAKAVNCLHPINGEPCNECENCLSVNAGNFVDVVEVDAASNNGVDDIRRIIEEVRYTPVKGKYKVFIIDEAHMITGPAFNAFLKTLEEPPSYAVFILATTEPYKLPITILSRCQRYDFKRISSDEITANLAQITTNEQVEADERALRYIARIGDGSMRDSISLLDKCIAFNLGEKLTYDNVLETLGTVDTEVFSRIFRYVYASDAAGALNQIDAAVADGRNLTQFTSDLIWYIRNILMVNAAHLESPEMLGLSAENMAQLMEDARDADNNVLIRYIRILSETLNQLRASTNKQVLLEVAIIKLAKPQMEVDTQSLADRIRQLEAKQGTAAFSYNQAAVISQEIDDTCEVHESNQPMPDDMMDDEEFFAGFGSGTRMTDPDVFADIMDDDVRITYDEAETDSRMIYTENEPDTGSQMKPAANEQEYRPTYDLCSLWPRIVDACSLPMLQRVMRKCRVSQPDEKTLRISAELEVQVKQLRAESAMHFMQEMAEKLTGMHIDIQVIQDNGGNAGASAFPEDVLSNINFNIGTEEK